MDRKHVADLEVGDLLSQCEVRRSRGSGPGGQHRNKVETAITIVHSATGISASASERRSQATNHKVAVFRLRVKLAVGVRCAVEMGDSGGGGESYGPSVLWRERCVGGRIRVNEGHDAFPSVLAEAMDVVEACGQDVARAAGVLGCSGTQLIKLLRGEPEAFERVNRSRAGLGLHRLR